nr:PREDICTED: integrator complex subunit 5 [Bemisia tabaci]
MACTSVIKSHPPGLLAQLRQFIAGASQPNKSSNQELARLALSLLNSLPAARGAVLEYLCFLFDSAVANHISQCLSPESPTKSQEPSEEEVTIAEIHTTLTNFIHSNANAWAPIISRWSLELLGTLSSRYANKASASMASNLSQSMQFWMACRATRTLIDINTQCLSCLMDSNTDSCISALLDFSVLHSPAFDWVVAHVGSCFPQTVITRVLSCGLKDFCENQLGTKAPKIVSVVSILDHLALSHFSDIKKALLQLFEWSMMTSEVEDDKLVLVQKLATTPFLLQLASMSPVLLRALSSDVLHSLTPCKLSKMSNYAADWCSYFDSRQALFDLVVHLILRCESGAIHILSLLLKCSQSEGKVSSMSDISREILELLLSEMDRTQRTASSVLPFLNNLQQNVAGLHSLLLSCDILSSRIAVRLVILLGRQNYNTMCSSIAQLLLKSKNKVQLAALLALASDCRGSELMSSSLTLALQMCRDHMINPPSDDYLLTLWVNVDKLLRWEESKKNMGDTCSPMLQAMWDNLARASECLQSRTNIKCLHCIALSINRAISQPKHRLLSIPLSISLATSTVSYFFKCLSLEEDGVKQKKSCNVINNILKQLCSISPHVISLLYRELIETALFRPAAKLFNASKISEESDYSSLHVNLLEENLKQGTSLMIPHRPSSVFYAGVIGAGAKIKRPVDKLPEEIVNNNIRLFIAALASCCNASDNRAMLDSVINIALLLVELISPDVMYNGLPWPEEEFCKVTVERDLKIRRLFDCSPIAWELLAFVAQHRPALCYCSVLLRAVVATLISEWGKASQQSKDAIQDKNSNLLKTTTRLLDIMALGQLLPQPLSSLQHTLHALPPNWVVLILRDSVWNYMRDHVPSPTLFVPDANGIMWRDPALDAPNKQYTDSLRLVMQRNVDKLGPLYSHLFIHLQQE